MCIRQVVTAFGIPVTFDDRHTPVVSCFRRTIGLDKAQEPAPSPSIQLTQQPKRQIKPIITKAVAGLVISPTNIKMGCGMGGRKLIRGSAGGF